MKITFFSLALFFTVIACNSAPSESAVSAESKEVTQLGGF
jgi:hypothetical protein